MKKNKKKFVGIGSERFSLYIYPLPPGGGLGPGNEPQKKVQNVYNTIIL